jgi:amino acid permease
MLNAGLACLPFAFSGVGWVLGFSFLFLLWALHCFTGVLLGRCRNIYPGAVSLADLAAYAYGPRAMLATFTVVTTAMVFILAEYVVVMGYSLQIAFVMIERPGLELGGTAPFRCAIIYLVFASVFLVPLAQFRTLFPSSMLFCTSNVLLVVTLGVWGVSIITGGQMDVVDESTVWPALAVPHRIGAERYTHVAKGNLPPVLGQTLNLLQSVALMSFALSFQIVTLEIIAEMRKPGADYPRSLSISAALQLAGALYVTAIGYWQSGNDSPTFFLAQLLTGPAWAGVVCGICFALSVLIAAALKTTILLRSLQLFIRPQSVDQPSWRARAEWFGLSMAVIAAVFAISIAMPFYEVLASFIGAACMPAVDFILPSLFYVKAMRNSGRKVHRAEWAAIVVVNAVAFILMTVGVVHTLTQLIAHWERWMGSEFRKQGVLKCMTPKQFLFQFTNGQYESVILARTQLEALRPEAVGPAGAASGESLPIFGPSSDSPLGVPG